MSKILVTGASGFIGRALTVRLIASGREVVSVDSTDGDIANRETLAKFAQQDIAHVFHLAGRTFVPDSWDDPQAFCQTNVLGTVNVLEFCRKNHIPMTYVSAYVYGHPDSLPIGENSAIRPSNPYALTKRLAEEACEFYASAYDLPVTTIRPFNVYGIGQTENFLIPAIISQTLNDGEEIVVKDLAPRRDYVYLEDLVTALLATLAKAGGYRVYNIGSGASLSVQEVIHAIQDIAVTHKKVVCDNATRANELMDVVADISKAGNELGWHPEFTFHAGIENIIRSKRDKEARMNKRNVPINKGNYSMDTAEREAVFEKNRGDGWEKEYAEYRRNWSEYAKQQQVSDYPLLVDIELSSTCNLTCPMCYTITDEFKKHVNVTRMDWELYKKIIDEIGGKVTAIRLSLRGEATLHTKFIEAIKYAKDSGIKEVSTLTHGGKLTLPYFKKMVEAGIDWITVSADGVGETYERVRKPLKFNDLLDKLKAINKYKEEHGLKRPVIKVQGIWPGIVESGPDVYYDTFKTCTDLVAFNPLIDYLSNDTHIEYLEEFTCPQQYQRLVIGADGLVMKCSNDEENREVIGDIKQDTVHQVWHGEKMQAVRNMHLQPRGFMQSAVCRKCYLPRKTEDEEAQVGERTFIVRNYVHRIQLIGK